MTRKTSSLSDELAAASRTCVSIFSQTVVWRRLRVLGEALPDWRRVSPDAAVDLAAIANGAHIVDASDRFFGEPAQHADARHVPRTWATAGRRNVGADPDTTGS